MHDVLCSIREGKPMSEMGTDLFSNAERYLKSPAQMQKLFSDLPDVLARTVEIAQACQFSPAELRYQYPSEWIPEGETAQSHLEKLVWQGASLRFGKVPDDVRKQLVHELELTKQLSFADYFLTIWEIVDFARKREILCQGRGSAANSAICYCLGITAIDPVKMNLLFERFISAERNEPPDIDVDFEHERREEVIQHIYEKYGRHRAGMVANVICYRSKSSRREVLKAFGMDPDSPEVEEILSKNPRAEKLAHQLIDEIEGFPRHLGIHSGGFTLSKDPLIETVPIEPARMENRTVVQWDKDDLACIGLLKVDVLSLGMLTALRKTFDLVRAKKTLTLASVPADDVETYKMIRRGETVGVFQIESRAQMGMLKRLLPENFYDLVIQIAIVRPGPIVGQMVHPYLRRRRKQEAIDIPHPALHPILDRTLGVPLFQEQVMKIAIVLAGFTGGEADELRRAINAWKSKGSIEKMGLKLMKGLLAAGLKHEFVERIFKQIQGFAEYGFPESHSASFAILAYASSYLKCHFPGEFACALINSQPMGFYSSHTIVEEARRQGVRVLPVDINRSEWDCDWVKDDDGMEALRIGLRVVRGLNEDLAQELVEARKKKLFVNLMDFLSRTKLSQPCLQSLAMGEAFACFGLNQRDSLWKILSYRILTRPTSEKAETQMNLFEKISAHADIFSISTAGEEFPALNAFQAIRSDYQVYGLSTRGHPMKELRKYFNKVPQTTTGFVKAAAIGRVLKIAGLVIARQRPPNAKGTCFATLEDEEGFIDLILHNDVFEQYREVFVDQPFIVATGKVQRDGAATSILVHRLEPVAEEGTDVQVRPRNFH
jgi:error-prone DNA polymerase